MDNTNDKNGVAFSDQYAGSADETQKKNPVLSGDGDQISELQREIQDQLSQSTHDTTVSNDFPAKEPELSNGPTNASSHDDFPFPSVASKHQLDEGVQPTSLVDIDNPGISSEAAMSTTDSGTVSEQQTIEDLQNDIASQFSSKTEALPVSDIPGGVQQEQAAVSNTKLGIGETYYSGLNKAMTANEPRTMSELIQQSAYEKRAQERLSPTSKKNLMYILGTVFFLIISVVAWLLVFGAPEQQAEFITKERVSSLVFSDEDLGINTTGIQTFQTKSAIRSVVDRDHTPDSISQIYYVQEDSFGNLRRMGVKDIFDKTESKVPELLYDNIENEFMHGVYTTDKSYPFIILKTLSYDRAFEGMKQWEPTMIDDLATYFDLPPEALERSLREDGFSDDLIKNKNVRVARYVPRESDRRGILDFLKSDGSELKETDSDVNVDENIFDSFFNGNQPDSDDSLAQRVLNILMFPIKPEPVYAQTDDGIGGTFLSDTINNPATGAATTICYKATKVCFNLMTGEQLPGNTTPSDTITCYDSIFDPNNPESVGQTFTPEQVQGQSGYICRNVLSGGDAVTGAAEIDTLYTDLVCFNKETGDRLPPLTDGTSYQQSNTTLCYLPYRCTRVACFQDGREVASSQEGQPGVSCRATDEIVAPKSSVRKSCVQYHELLTLKNISSMNLCFDQNGRFVPFNSRIENLQDYYANYAGTSELTIQQLMSASPGLRCISPQSINSRLCVTTAGEIIPGIANDGKDISQNAPNIEVCFKPFSSSNLSDEFNTSINAEIKQELAAIAQQLRSLAVLASGFGLFPNDVSDKLYEASDFLIQIIGMNLLENETIMKIAEVTRFLELILNEVDPGAPNSQVVKDLRDIIEHFKSLIGLNRNVAWVTIGNRLPQGVDIYADGRVSGGSLTSEQTSDAISAVQQSLVLLGLMDPLSVTGSLDLVTQQALQTFQQINGYVDGDAPLSVDQIFISAQTLELIQQIVEGSGTLFGGMNSVTIDNYFSETLGLGKYSSEVQQLQIILYSLGYNISVFNGIFDEEVCSAVQQYQVDNGLELADPQECVVSVQTIESLNEKIREENYFGSGYTVNANGALEGTGVFLGTFGPGTVSFEVGDAEAYGLREGDIVLMYTFLDEETILITRHESVITEVVRRRALSGIFN